MFRSFARALSLVTVVGALGAVPVHAITSNVITFTSVTHNFGQVVDGASSTYGVKATNSGSSAFAFAINLSGSSEFTQYNGCGTSLAAGASCEIVFTFAPTTADTESATWSLTSNGYSFTPSDGGTLSGTGSTSVGFTVTSAKHDFGTQVINTTSSSTYGVVLSNSTSDPITLTLDTTAPEYQLFPLTLNNCGATLPSHGSCNLQWKFHPVSVVAYASDFGISGVDATTGQAIQLSSGGTAVSTVKLRGSGISTGTLNLSTGGHAFGEVANGLTSLVYGALLTNATGSAVNVTYGAVPGAFKVVATSCTSTLAAGASCDLQFKFEPTSTGSYSGTYTISATKAGGTAVPVYANGSTTSGLLLSGTSITGGLALDNSTYQFGVYVPGQTSATYETQLLNTSADTLNISLTPDGGSDDASFVIHTGTCGATLAPNAFCDLKVQYSPQATGTQVLTETITATDAVTGEYVGVYDSTTNSIVTGVVEDGTAVAGAVLALSSTSHNFGEIGVNGTSAGYTSSLVNSTQYALNLSTSWSNPGESANFVIYSTPCGSSIPAHTICAIKFEFEPTATGAYDNTYSITGTVGAYTTTTSTELTGTGVN